MKDLKTDLERAEYLKNLLISHATGTQVDTGEFMTLRRYFLERYSKSNHVPDFVRVNRDLPQFWQFIKTKFQHYAERRAFINEEFRPLLEFLEKVDAIPSANMISEVLGKFDSKGVQFEWTKALHRTAIDPEGAITAARTLLETVCKHMLEESRIEFDESSDLPKLYSLVAKDLVLSPIQHSEKTFRQILQGCSSVIDGLGSLRNKLGDAHGKGKNPIRPKPRHAVLAVNFAGAMALFLVQTWIDKKQIGIKKL